MFDYGMNCQFTVFLFQQVFRLFIFTFAPVKKNKATVGMMRTLLHILSKTYPFFYGDRKNNVITFIIASVFVLHVMLIMRPDLITRNIQTNYTLAAFAYALITFATSIAWIELLPRFAENWFRHWKVYKELLLTGSCIVAMGFLNYAYIALFGRTDFSFEIKVEDALKIVSLT